MRSTPAELQRRSRLAGGLCAICLLFLLETWNADRIRPHPASPYIWAVLGAVAAVALAAALWYGRRARAARGAKIASPGAPPGDSPAGGAR